MIIAFPTLAQAEQAGMLLYGWAVTKQEVPTLDLINACWVIAGYGATFGPKFVHPEQSAVGKNLEMLQSAFAHELAAHTQGHLLLGQGVDWSKLAPIVIQILQIVLSGSGN